MYIIIFYDIKKQKKNIYKKNKNILLVIIFSQHTNFKKLPKKSSKTAFF